MDLLELAIYDLVHKHQGGAPALAAATGMRAGTLQNKADPGMEAQLNLREAVAVSLAAGDYRILHAMAAMLGHATVRLGDYRGISDVELLGKYAEYHAQVGRTADAVRGALADGRLCRAEIRQVETELHADFRAGLELLARLEALCDDPDGD